MRVVRCYVFPPHPSAMPPPSPQGEGYKRRSLDRLGMTNIFSICAPLYAAIIGDPSATLGMTNIFSICAPLYAAIIGDPSTTLGMTNNKSHVEP